MAVPRAAVAVQRSGLVVIGLAAAGKLPSVERLRRSRADEPGISRRRRGAGFSYSWADGHGVTDPEVLARIRGLVIPPAWREVWICPWANGHVQATGIDAAGRRQYLYHDNWRARRDSEKFDRMVEFASKLAQLRQQVERKLALPGMPRDRVLAAALRLLDLGFFRIGGEEYAEAHKTFGLSTLRKDHVRVHGAIMEFRYQAKGDKAHYERFSDAPAAAVMASLRRRRTGGERLLAWRQGRSWVPVHSSDINTHLKELTGGDFSAKDFRTWSATVMAAVALGVSWHASTPSSKNKAVLRCVREVAHYLGNTPAVARASYIDPRVIDCFEAGRTIGGAVASVGGEPPTAGPVGASVEAAVVELLRSGPRGPAEADPLALGDR